MTRDSTPTHEPQKLSSSSSRSAIDGRSQTYPREIPIKREKGQTHGVISVRPSLNNPPKIVAYYLFFQLLLPPRFLSFLTRKGSRLVLFFLCLVIKVEKVPIVVTYQSFCPAFHFSSEASRYLSFKNRRLFLSPFSWSV